MSTSLSPYMDQILKNSMNSFNFMNTHKILPTSENYQLWYSYTAQDDFSLNRVVDKLITNKTSLDEDISKKLYKKFFSEDTENKTLVNTSRGFKDEITKLKFILQDAGKDTSSYSGSINNQKDKLTNFNGSDELKEIAKLVVQDIENINSQTQKLNAQIDKSSKKIETLKNNLE
ncbi:MAG: hypothetical protein P8I94_04155, partial [Emcibacteraceae bacterium]|nr:hypothetical protein [Emcibacteraceae bacterium]